MKEEIVRCEEEFFQAMRVMDIQTLDKLLHDRLIYNNFTGEVLTKEMDMKGAKSGVMTVDSVECLEREIELFDDTAMVSTVAHLKASLQGNDIDVKTRFLRTWKKFDDGWKIIGASSINLP